jgi:hypothetical protein
MLFGKNYEYIDTKIKNKETKNEAFNFLLELINNSEKNFEYLMEILINYFEKNLVKSIYYKYNPLPFNKNLKYIGLKNQGKIIIF